MEAQLAFWFSRTHFLLKRVTTAGGDMASKEASLSCAVEEVPLNK